MTVNVVIMRAPVSPGGASALRVSVDGGRGEDLYALWNSVFEGTHVTDGALPSSQSVAPQAAEALVGAQVQAGSEEGTGPAEFAEDLSALDTLQGAIRYAGESSALPNVGHAPAAAVADVPDAVGTSSSPRVVDPAEPRDATDVSEAPRVGASVKEEHLAAHESALVFVHGAAVEIVVRNSSLSEADAVHTAFETARELTGQRSALLRLTLNGRTIYQQADESSRQAPSGSELVFAC